jgi:hypothetical protein
MKKISQIILSGFMAISMMTVPTIVLSAPAQAETAQDAACRGAGGTPSGGGCTGGQSGSLSLTATIRNIVNILLFVIGLVAVIMIIIGGLRYVLSGGDQSAVTGAKNTILYAVIGLIVALLAYAIVNFVVGGLT